MNASSKNGTLGTLDKFEKKEFIVEEVCHRHTIIVKPKTLLDSV